jgi:HYDIN/CFA65/VesB family protein
MRRVLAIPAAVATFVASLGVLVVAAGPVAAGAASAASPQVAIFPSSVSFGSQRVGSLQRQSVSVQNVGDAPMHVYSVNLNDYSGSYSLVFNNCAGATIPQGNLCQFTIEYHPRAPGQHNANAYVNDDAPGRTQNVPIWGNATS